MNDDDLSKVLQDAVADVGGVAPAGALTNRLRRVDHRRKLSAVVAGATAIVAGTFGVAAAWPEDHQPIRLYIGNQIQAEQIDDGPEVDPIERQAVAAEEALDLSDDRTVAALTEPEDHEADLDWEPTFELAPIQVEEPEPEPEVVPTPKPQIAPTPVPAPKQEQGDSGNKKAPKGGGEEESGEEEPPYSFTAASAYGSCEEPIPYDIYSGTAAPEATVTVTSPHSATTTTTADGSGHWSVEVTFEAAPVGEPFTVTAVSDGQSVGLSFVRTG